MTWCKSPSFPLPILVNTPGCPNGYTQVEAPTNVNVGATTAITGGTTVAPAPFQAAASAAGGQGAAAGGAVASTVGGALGSLLPAWMTDPSTWKATGLLVGAAVLAIVGAIVWLGPSAGKVSTQTGERL